MIVDAGNTGAKNDELTEIAHLLNLSQTSPVFYGGSATSVAGSTASVTVFGAAPLDVTNPSSPSVDVVTTYAVTTGNSWIDIETVVTNGNPFPVPVFQVTDTDITVTRGRIPFQPFPARGSKNPPLDLSDLFSAFGVMPFVATPGLVGPEDGEVTTDGSPKGDVSYMLVAPSLAAPLMGIAGGTVVAVGNAFDLAGLAGGSIPTIAPGDTLTHTRRLVVTATNDVESALNEAAPGLGLGLRAEFTGRVVDGDGAPVGDAHLFFDNTFPGADPALVGLVTTLDENRDGVIDGVVPVAAGDPVPLTHVITGPDGVFTVRLPALVDPNVAASVYSGEIRASERDYATIGPFSVDLGTLFGGPTNLGDLVVSDTGTLEFTVTEENKDAVAGHLRIFGVNGTPDPDLGSQYSSARSYSGLVPGGGADPVDGGNSSELTETLGGLPALNVAVTATGTGTVSLAPGDYRAVATRGLEWTTVEKEFTIRAGKTTKAKFDLERAFNTQGFVSADFHIHSARSFDSSAPPEDRVAAYLAKGVEVLVASDHDKVSDWSGAIANLGVGKDVTSLIGNETTGTIPVPPAATFGIDAFPQGIGHWNAWPLEVNPTARRSGAPSDELIGVATAIDRLRGIDSLKLLPGAPNPDDATIGEWLAAIQAGQPGTPGAALPPDEEVVMLNHPRAGLTGIVVIGLFTALGGLGYDPALPITAAPNNLLLLPSLYNESVINNPAGTDTTGISFDALEIMNGPGITGYQRVREDWFSLLRQGIHVTGTAVADSHRVILENAGYPRSYIASSTDKPDELDENELTAAVKAMKVIGTSGPYIEFSMLDAGGDLKGLGETVAVLGDTAVASITVFATPWMPVEEVRIYRNGVLSQTLPVDADKVLGTELRFSEFVVLENVDEDLFVTVEAGVAVDANGDPLDAGLIAGVQAIEPDVEPLGFTNPIFVDRDGDGYTPPGL
jgi:hypothetical protein